MSNFWSIYIIVLMMINVIGCLWLLQTLSQKRMPDDPDTTEHVWDTDLREYNNPLPRWWLWLFWLTAIWTFVYLALYPGFGNFGGLLGWTQTEQYEEQLEAAEERYGDVFAAFSDMSLQDMASDPDAVRIGRNLFLNNCATCHGSDGRGAKGFPNLTDDSWLYGGSPETIKASITNGRIGVMPALGAALGEAGTDQVVAYLQSLSSDAAPSEAAQAGRKKFAQFCVACHGPDATGVPAVGGPNLADGYWLHGGSAADLRDVIVNGRVNRMPAQSDLLGEERIRTLVAYVLSLSGAGER